MGSEERQELEAKIDELEDRVRVICIHHSGLLITITTVCLLSQVSWERESVIRDKFDCFTVEPLIRDPLR